MSVVWRLTQAWRPTPTQLDALYSLTVKDQHAVQRRQRHGNQAQVPVEKTDRKLGQSHPNLSLLLLLLLCWRRRKRSAVTRRHNLDPFNRRLGHRHRSRQYTCPPRV